MYYRKLKKLKKKYTDFVRVGYLTLNKITQQNLKLYCHYFLQQCFPFQNGSILNCKIIYRLICKYLNVNRLETERVTWVVTEKFVNKIGF